MMREEGEAVTLPTTIDTTKRTYSLNMPQMAMGGLSESWCLKEFGDLHWGMILSGLGTSSSKLADGLGERLYATFTRIKYDSTHPLSAFTEDENVVIEGNLTRLGAGIFISNITLSGSNKSIKANAMSSFTKRGAISSNVDLLKGQPNIPDDCPIQVINEMPRFGLEYRNLREGLFSEPLFESSYDIIPYHDINGVDLLYFAAYPIISDICELRYMNVGNRWATRASTVKRDIYYFANSDPDKPLIYRVHLCRKLDSGIEIESSISRADDNKMMAYIITRKDVADE
jgi:probable biosynthetic protein (TIGR04098 family)